MLEHNAINALVYILAGYDNARLTAVETVELMRGCLNLSTKKIQDHVPAFPRVPADWPHPSEVDLTEKILDWEASVRTSNVLETNGFTTARDVYEAGEDKLLRLPNFGKKSLKEIGEILRCNASNIRDRGDVK